MLVSLHIILCTTHIELVSGIDKDSLKPPDDGVTKKTIPPPGPVSPTTHVPPCAHVRPAASTLLDLMTTGTAAASALTPSTVAARKIRRIPEGADISMNITVIDF
jgi:hypothetical protein